MDDVNVKAKFFVMKDIADGVNSAGFLYAKDWTIEAAFT